MKQDSGQPGLTKSPQALSLHDAQQPPTLGNVFKRFSVSSLTNACCRNTKQNQIFRKKGQWLERWVDDAGYSREGAAESRLVHSVLPREVTTDKAQQKGQPDSASPNPTAVHMPHVFQCLWRPMNTWLKGTKAMAKAETGKEPRNSKS